MRSLVLARTDEVFHLHLLELTRAKDEIAGRHFIAKRFSDLRDAEGKLAPHGRLHVQEIDKDALRRFRSEVSERRRVIFFGGCTDGRTKHEVKWARVSPFSLAAIWALNLTFTKIFYSPLYS